MIGRAWALALNTFRDAIRHRVLYGILAVVFGVNLFAIVLGEMSEHRIGSVIVTENDTAVGIFTTTDAVTLFAESLRAGDLPEKLQPQREGFQADPTASQGRSRRLVRSMPHPLYPPAVTRFPVIAPVVKRVAP